MISAVAQPVLVQVISDKERLRNIFRKMIRFGAFVSFPTMCQSIDSLHVLAEKIIEEYNS